MRLVLFALVATFGVLGCGPETTINTTPLSDEQKKAIQEEDQRVAEEEGGKPVKVGGKAGSKK